MDLLRAALDILTGLMCDVIGAACVVAAVVWLILGGLAA